MNFVVRLLNEREIKKIIQLLIGEASGLNRIKKIWDNEFDN